MPIIVTDNGVVEVEPDPTPGGVTPRPPIVKQQFAFHWTGVDGTTWDLVNGPVQILSGARGFGIPTPQHWRRPSLGHGTAHNGLRFPERPVYMPVELKPARADMLEFDRLFAAGLTPYGTGRLRVTTPTAEYREIVCRYDEGLEGEYETDPLLKGSALYPIRLTAEDPFWRGAPVEARFRVQTDTEARDTFPGPPFYRRRADTLDGTGTVDNPGDVEAFPVWTITAPFTGFEVGIGDQLVKMTLAKTTGTVTIDTTGGMTTMYDETGKNVRANATDFRSTPIPTGSVTLRVDVQNPGATSEAVLSFEPRYLRAW